jgi:hypothetical protein
MCKFLVAFNNIQQRTIHFVAGSKHIDYLYKSVYGFDQSALLLNSFEKLYIDSDCETDLFFKRIYSEIIKIICTT